MFKRPSSISELILAHWDRNINPFNFNYRTIVGPIFTGFNLNSYRYILRSYIRLLNYNYYGVYIEYISHLKQTAIRIYRILWIIRRGLGRWRGRCRHFIFVNDTDLLMMELREPTIPINDKYNHIFRFTSSDIISIYKSALSSYTDMIPLPSIPENPYNRRPISPICSIFIYYRLRCMGIRIPHIMLLYEESRFDIERFKDDWRPWLTFNRIKSYLDTAATIEELQYAINNVIKRELSQVQIKRLVPIINTMSRVEILSKFKPLLCDEYARHNGYSHRPKSMILKKWAKEMMLKPSASKEDLLRKRFREPLYYNHNTS